MRFNGRSWSTLFISLLFAVGALALAQESKPAAQPPAPFLDAHWHHLHLNATDPKAAIDFYTSKFDAEKARFAGLVDAVWTQKSWMLFTKTAKPPISELTSAIWHFGWGAEDMKATYEKQVAAGTKFETPITDISDIGGAVGAKGLFYYAYVEGPDKQLIELNTANHHHFGHLHLFSADPVAAGEWYKKYLNAKSRSPRPPSREARFYRDIQIGPSVSLMSDNVNIIIFPMEYPKKAYPDAWKGRTEFDSTRGHTTDHIGFSVENLTEAIAKLRADGVKVTDEIRSIGPVKFAFIEGPDKVRIELVEGHARKE
ncbi:MAG: VOC family protein [Blastocatellia bacterium]|nr:VOC family protein [Blastocatellia bacterium]